MIGSEVVRLSQMLLISVFEILGLESGCAVNSILQYVVAVMARITP